MTDSFVQVPQHILKQLIEKGDKIVLYSSFGTINSSFNPINSSVDKTAPMIVRSNEEFVIKTMMGEKLGSAYKSYSDPHAYGLSYDYYNIELKMVKLPFDLLDDNLLKFISLSDNTSEILHYNNLKLHFNEKGEYIIW
jgi:HKD family nuclease